LGTSGSVGVPGGQPPGSTRPVFVPAEKRPETVNSSNSYPPYGGNSSEYPG
jgi:hypothetical protein